jgi:hypothetical protein
MSSEREGHAAYLSYLLRLWRTYSAGEPVWRASLENPLTEEIVRFDDLPSLWKFLHAQTGQGLAPAGGDGHPPPALG